MRVAKQDDRVASVEKADAAAGREKVDLVKAADVVADLAKVADQAKVADDRAEASVVAAVDSASVRLRSRLLSMPTKMA